MRSRPQSEAAFELIGERSVMPNSHRRRRTPRNCVNCALSTKLVRWSLWRLREAVADAVLLSQQSVSRYIAVNVLVVMVAVS